MKITLDNLKSLGNKANDKVKCDFWSKCVKHNGIEMILQIKKEPFNTDNKKYISTVLVFNSFGMSYQFSIHCHIKNTTMNFDSLSILIESNTNQDHDEGEALSPLTSSSFNSFTELTSNEIYNFDEEGDVIFNNMIIIEKLLDIVDDNLNNLKEEKNVTSQMLRISRRAANRVTKRIG